MAGLQCECTIEQNLYGGWKEVTEIQDLFAADNSAATSLWKEMVFARDDCSHLPQVHLTASTSSFQHEIQIIPILFFFTLC